MRESSGGVHDGGMVLYRRWIKGRPVSVDIDDERNVAVD